MNQINLFNTASSDSAKHKDTLFILKDGHIVKMKPNKIFDSNKFTELRAVTYSATGSFITKYLSNFSKICIIEGLPQNKQVASTFHNLSQVARNTINTISDGLFSNNLIKFIEHLSNDVRKKIIQHNFDLRIPISRTIHEKFYLLNNPKTHETRVIVGSANLSYQAMSNSTKQNEGLWIKDNDTQTYNKMLSHFKDLYSLTSSYLSNVTRRVLGKQVKQIDSKHPKQQQVLTKNEKKDIKKAVVPSAIKQIETKIAHGEASPEIIRGFKNITDQEPELKKHLQAEMAKEMALVDLTQSTVSRSRKDLRFKNLNSITKSIPRHLRHYKVNLRKTGRTKHVNVQSKMVFDQPEDRQYDTDTGLRVDDHGVKVPFGHPVEKAAIKKDLQIINTLLASYKKYAYKANTEYQSRAMEVILYALTSFFLGDIRQQIDPGIVRDIPLFFIIGGARKTGKTSLLKFVIKMLGIYPLDEHDTPIIKRYADLPIDGAGNVGKKTGHINFIHDYMTSEFVTPLAVNEIDDSFNSNHIGSQLIVRTAGEFGDYSHRQFSALIGVTNNDHYDLDAPAKDGRSYYLNFGRHIPETPDGSKLIQKLTATMDNSLALDFAHQFSNLLSKHVISKTYSRAFNNGHFDFLYWSRKIMCHEYKKVGMTPPDCMPTDIYDDSTSAGRSKWRDFYIAHYAEFQIDPTNKNRMEISTNKFKQGRYNNNANSYISMLPSPSVCPNPSAKTNEVVLNRNHFFKYINLDEKDFLHKEEQQKIQQEARNKFDSHKADILYERKKQQILGKRHGFLYNLIHHNK